MIADERKLFFFFCRVLCYQWQQIPQATGW